MKRIISFCLIVAIALSLASCASGELVPETEIIPTVPDAAMSAEAETVAQQTQQPETEPVVLEGFLFLTVSSITFSVVGESEDIYIGSLPRDQVVWESADPDIIAVQDGVLTAVGTGTTTISVSYLDQYWECTASCLAETEEELLALDSATLRTAKRIPPQLDETELLTYYDDAAIVGDSISYILFQWESMLDYLGEPLFLVRGGTSLNGVVERFFNIYYKGKDTNLEDALQDCGANKVFIMLGQNDLSRESISVDDALALLDTLIGRIRSKNPDIEIYMESVLPEWVADNGDNAKNEKIRQYNEKLKVYCQENDYNYVDIAMYVEDHMGKMATPYSMDQSIHMNYEGTYVWMQAFRAYAKLQELRGE